MTKEKYLILCESQGIEPNEKHMPLDLSDFPQIVSIGTLIFNDLRDSYIPGEIPIYTGKDLSPLNVLLDIHEITDPSEKKLVLNIINILDAEAVKAAKQRSDALRKKKPGPPGVKGGSRT